MNTTISVHTNAKANAKTLLLQVLPHEKPYTYVCTQYIQEHFFLVKMHAAAFKSKEEFIATCRHNKIFHIATTDFQQYKLFDPTVEGTAASSEGALFVDLETNLKILLLPPIKNIHTTNAGGFLLNHWIKKLIGIKEDFPIPLPPLNWQQVTTLNYTTFQEAITLASIIAIDIETTKTNLLIRSVSYTTLQKSQAPQSWVIDLEYAKDYELDFLLTLIRNANASLAPKVFQNGRYDNSYFLRFGAPVYNYLFDTYHLFHCLYPELPKSLSFISSFCLPNFRFWKDESSTNSLEYNAKDSHNTLFSFLALLAIIKAKGYKYALTNYINFEFPLVFPCIHCGQEGLIVDMEKRKLLRSIEAEKVHASVKTITILTGMENINLGSPKQVLALQKALGFAKAEGTDKTAIRKFAEAHPLYPRIANCITAYRKASKAINTYYDAELLDGLMLYELDPAGTVTWRMASKESNYWCGSQIQNQPAYCKDMYIPTEGWLFGCVDGAQAESRTTAYISGDINLINTVETSADFHCTNASLFFGIPFSELYSPAKGVLRPDIRKIAKAVNHGSNYNMGWYILAETMGEEKVWEAKTLLNLPTHYGIKEICIHLLETFNKTYPDIRGKYYPKVLQEVQRTGRLVAVTGLTRRTFLKPDKSKRDLNEIVAHGPQNLSVATVNRAFFKAWEWQVFGGGRGKIRIKAQIHDEIFFMHTKDSGQECAEKVGEFMREPMIVYGREMIIPNEPKWGAPTWGKLK